MASMEPDPNRTTTEIRNLLRNLDPKNPKSGGHKDRKRRLQHFRTYMSGEQTGGSGNERVTTPEYYDDDLPLLLLGSEEPPKLYGLLQACGTPSSDHDHMLKRSAKTAMSLLKYLVTEFRDMVDGRPLSDDKQLNSFAVALCSCTKEQLRVMNLELHVTAIDEDKRTGAKEDACRLIILLCTHHLAPDTVTSQPLLLEELLPSNNARKSFNQWLTTIPESQQEEFRTHQQATKNIPTIEQLAQNEETTKKKDDEPRNEMGLKLDMGDDAPKTWAESELSVVMTDGDDDGTGGRTAASERDRKRQQEEKERAEEEKKRVVNSDPLELRGEDFDLRLVQKNKEFLIEEAMKAFDEEEEEMSQLNQESDSKKNRLEKLLAVEERRDAFQAMLDRINEDDDEEESSDEEDEEEEGATRGSVVPTDEDFDPMLFLTLVHGRATFKQLKQGMEKLNSKQDNQAARLQNLVRENFELFVRCADGIDVLAEDFIEGGGTTGDDDNPVKKSKKAVTPLATRLKNLDKHSNSCSQQAKKSFKPLLDNTNEVRKTQSALAVLSRSGALLQVPALMRQHVECGRFSAAVKAYRRVLVIDDDCHVELLQYVKSKAADAARDARRDLESTLGSSEASVATLLDAIRDLGELNDLDVPDASMAFKTDVLREHQPALACLLLQTNHFSSLVERTITHATTMVNKIYAGDSSVLLNNNANNPSSNNSTTSDGNGSETRSSSGETLATESSRRHRRWRYDVLEARVISTKESVAIIGEWLPRLIRIGVAAREAERHREARSTRRHKPKNQNNNPTFARRGDHEENSSDEEEEEEAPVAPPSGPGAYDILISKITPSVSRLVQHAAYCALGRPHHHRRTVVPTFGQDVPEALGVLLKTPLPPRESTKCASELARLVDVVQKGSMMALTLKRDVAGEGGGAAAATSAAGKDGTPAGDGLLDAGGDGNVEWDAMLDGNSRSHVLPPPDAPMRDCLTLAEEAVVTVERRRCIYAFDVCARGCSRRAVGAGVLDGDALLTCVQRLGEDVTRPEECSAEVQKGCQLVIRRCCEGLADYVRDRGDAARLRAVSECAKAINGRVLDVVHQVSYLTGIEGSLLEEGLIEDIVKIEAILFDEFLEGVRRNVASCVKLGYMGGDEDDDDEDNDEEKTKQQLQRPKVFPGYLSASLLAIVRCRAQVERALGESTVRRPHGVTYQYQSMATASDSVVNGICNEVNEKMMSMTKRQADRIANEFQFLINTLRNHLSRDSLTLADQCRRMLCSKAGREGGRQGEGPDGLAALEDLERLGRVYVLCLGE